MISYTFFCMTHLIKRAIKLKRFVEISFFNYQTYRNLLKVICTIIHFELKVFFTVFLQKDIHMKRTPLPNF